MRYVKTTAIVVGATALLAGGAATAQQDTSHRTTRLTFSAPVELPGRTLQAGTYTFRLADAKSDRHMVQVLDGNANTLITTVPAVPARRLHTEAETVVTFRETAATAPPALRYWYYPNDIMGQEFAYPMERAMTIAEASRQSVLAVDGNEIIRVQPEVLADETAVGTGGTASQAPLSGDAPTTPARRLPRTASNLPLVGLIGGLALGGALLARALRRIAL